MTERFISDLRRVGVMVAAVLISGCGSDSEPARAPADGIAIEVRASPDSPDSGGAVAVPGLWLIAVAQEARPADDRRSDVAALRAAGAEIVRTDGRGRATLRRAKGALLLADLGSSDAASPVAALSSGIEIAVNVGESLRLTFGEAGLMVTR